MLRLAILATLAFFARGALSQEKSEIDVQEQQIESLASIMGWAAKGKLLKQIAPKTALRKTSQP